MSKVRLKQRIQYWIENRISKSPLSLVRIMAIATIVVALIVTILITIFGTFSKDNFLYTFWDTFASSINAWLPSAEDGDNNLINIIFISLSSLFGLFFTSFLIGIVASSLEERIEAIKRGNSIVLEKNHIIVLGFIPGEYTLIKELIKATEKGNLSIVIADQFDKVDTETEIYENVDIPKNIKLVCRNIDTTNVTSLNSLAVDKCKSIIINPMDDEKTIKTIFSINYLFDKLNVKDCIVVATVKNKTFALPDAFKSYNNFIFLVLTDFVAKIIAHTCVQPGLSLVYLELFNNKGSEIYAIKDLPITGKKFKDVYLSCQSGIPLGIVSNENYLLNPSPDYIINENDSLVIVTENRNKKLELLESLCNISSCEIKDESYKDFKLLILGYNDSIKTILDELPKSINFIKIAGPDISKNTQLEQDLQTVNNIKMETIDCSIDDEIQLEKLISDINRVIILNNYGKDGNSADVKVMLRLTRLREIRERLNKDFTIGVEFRRAANRSLVHKNDYTDYIVRTNMLSMFLSQLSFNPELKPIYKELLSSGNSEIVLYSSTCIPNINCLCIKDVRTTLYNNGYLFLGYIAKKNGKYDIHMNPYLDEKLNLNDDDSLIIIKKTTTKINSNVNTIAKQKKSKE